MTKTLGLRHRRGRFLSKALLFALLSAGALLVLAPIYWLFISSVKTSGELALYPPTFWPREWHFENYVRAFTQVPFTRFTLNTVLYAVLSVVANVLVNSFISYGFAKIQFPGKGFWFALVLATMMIPGFVTLVPKYILFSKIGWVGWYLPLVVPQFFGDPFRIFMMRQFYRTIPNELIEAAKVDGASHFYIWARLMTPLVKPLLATVAIMAFKASWNDFQGPLLYVRREAWYTIQIGLQMFRGQNATQWNYIMAMSLFSMLPVLILFFLFQNYFIQGMNVSGATK
jgi:multiple sugar transport system permease protein